MNTQIIYLLLMLAVSLYALYIGVMNVACALFIKRARLLAQYILIDDIHIPTGKEKDYPEGEYPPSISYTPVDCGGYYGVIINGLTYECGEKSTVTTYWQEK